MSKKEFLLALLEKFQDDWLPAVGLKALIEANQLDDNNIDAIINLFQKAAAEVTNESLKVKLQKGIISLEHLKEMEIQARIQEEGDLRKLEEMLASM
jgi:preprotein translocase subunit SecB